MKSNAGALEFLILSTKRSSHHAFIEGLLRNRNSIYFNDCLTHKDNLISGETVEEFNDTSCERDHVKLVSFERKFALPEILYSPILDNFFENFGSAVKIIFLRDPINTAASTFNIYEKVKNNPSFSDTSYVRDNISQFVSVSKYVCSAQYKHDGVVFVYANRFWSDLDYQKSIVNSIGLSDAKFSNKMSFYGKGGNSFFGNKKEVSAEDLANRYRVYKENMEFMSLVRDKNFYSAGIAFLEYVGDREMASVFSDFF